MRRYIDQRLRQTTIYHSRRQCEAPVARLRELFGHLPCEVHATSIRAAEMVKYCCNNFHALKITFANETARLCEALDVDAFEVMDLVCKDRQLNISPAYLKPGFAFGGSCLPKDLRATLHMSKMRDVELPMHAGIMQSNRVHIDHAIAKVLASGKRRVGMIGLSFKTGTDDLRESPLVLLAEHFIGKGLSVAWCMTPKSICRDCSARTDGSSSSIFPTSARSCGARSKASSPSLTCSWSV